MAKNKCIYSSPPLLPQLILLNITLFLVHIYKAFVYFQLGCDLSRNFYASDHALNYTINDSRDVSYIEMEAMNLCFVIRLRDHSRFSIF